MNYQSAMPAVGKNAANACRDFGTSGKAALLRAVIVSVLFVQHTMQKVQHVPEDRFAAQCSIEEIAMRSGSLLGSRPGF
jgi:hypothetical protein